MASPKKTQRKLPPQPHKTKADVPTIKVTIKILDQKSHIAGMNKLFNCTDLDFVTATRVNKIAKQCNEHIGKAMSDEKEIAKKYAKLDEKGFPIFNREEQKYDFVDAKGEESYMAELESVFAREVEIKAFKINFHSLQHVRSLSAPEIEAISHFVEGLPEY